MQLISMSLLDLVSWCVTQSPPPEAGLNSSPYCSSLSCTCTQGVSSVCPKAQALSPEDSTACKATTAPFSSAQAAQDVIRWQIVLPLTELCMHTESQARMQFVHPLAQLHMHTGCQARMQLITMGWLGSASW